ncbi:hypothetical protein [Thiomicrorhabdus sediminis]|uniref:Uncharacterized protein n=1 Tax=Thiomicrorhabdus sediminis TaxID=2580412 RepID=A0A4P9K5E6_9GAMM|nr:hypothetical protein [Thiomicrorhabdus sediminis]QCU90078.1 hypothetical protein FE785_05235 [Thiomicrorhabdus sediminis]
MKYKLKRVASAVLMGAMLSANAYAIEDIQVNGLIEASLSQVESNDAQGAIDTVEIGFLAKINNTFDAELVLLDESLGTDAHTGVGIDRAVINANLGAGVLSLGKMTVPFTMGDSFMISDPVTLEEPVGVGAQFSGSLNNLAYSIYTTTPDNDYTQTGDNQFGDLYGVSLDYVPADNALFHASWVSVDGETSFSAGVEAGISQFVIMSQYTNMAGEVEPRLSSEMAYDFGFMTAAAGIQRGGDAKRYRLFGLSQQFSDNFEGKFEYLDNVDDSETTYTMQVAYSF